MPRDRVWRWRPSELRPLRDSGHPLQTAEYRKAVPEAEDREKFFSSSFQTVTAVLTAASHQLRFRAIALTLALALRGPPRLCGHVSLKYFENQFRAVSPCYKAFVFQC